MRIYPDADISFSIDKPSKWGSYIKHSPKHSWKLPEKNIRPKNMYYWRDIEGSKKKVVESDDLYFQDWPDTRIRPQACLGMLYSTGFRFIRLLKAPPVDFKCAPLPINLEMAYKVNDILKEKENAEKLAKKKLMEEEKAKKKAELEYKNRTKKKGRRS